MPKQFVWCLTLLCNLTHCTKTNWIYFVCLDKKRREKAGIVLEPMITDGARQKIMCSYACGWMLVCVMLCDCLILEIATKSSFDPNIPRPAYCIGLLLLSSYHRFRIVWFGFMRSLRLFTLSPSVSHTHTFLCVSSCLLFQQAGDLFIPCAYFRWVFVGSCHCVVRFFSIHFVNFHFCFFRPKHWTPVCECAAFSLVSLFCGVAIFLKWPICSMCVLYQTEWCFSLSFFPSLHFSHSFHISLFISDSTSLSMFLSHFCLPVASNPMNMCEWGDGNRRKKKHLFFVDTIVHSK